MKLHITFSRWRALALHWSHSEPAIVNSILGMCCLRKNLLHMALVLRSWSRFSVQQARSPDRLDGMSDALIKSGEDWHQHFKHHSSLLVELESEVCDLALESSMPRLEDQPPPLVQTQILDTSKVKDAISEDFVKRMMEASPKNAASPSKRSGSASSPKHLLWSPNHLRGLSPKQKSK